MRLRYLLLSGVVLCLLAACGGRTVGRPPTDGAAPPDASPPLPDGALPDPCEARFDLQVLQSSIDDWYSAQVAVTRGWVVYTSTQTTGADPPGDTEIFRRFPGAEPPDSEEQLSADDLHTTLLAAEGGGVLFASGPDQPGAMHLWLRNAAGDLVDLGEQTSALPSLWGLGEFSSTWRLLSGDRAVWADGTAVKLFDGGVTQVIYDDPDHVPSMPATDGDLVAFTARFDGAGDLFVYRSDAGLVRVTTTPDYDAHPVVSGDQVYWSCGGGVCRWSEGSVPEVLAEGFCYSLQAHGDQAAWVCDGRVQWLVDGQIHTVSSTDVQVLAVRLHSGRLAWVEHTVDTYPPAGDPRVVYYAGGRTFDVAPVIPSCMAGHIDTLPALALGEGLVAWCHSMHAPDADEACEFAQIEESGACDPVP